MRTIIIPARYQAQIYSGDSVIAESELFDEARDAMKKLKNPAFWPDVTIGHLQRLIFVLNDHATGDCQVFSYSEVNSNTHE